MQLMAVAVTLAAEHAMCRPAGAADASVADAGVSRTEDNVKIFFFMGRNQSTRSGVSWKIWKIFRTGRTVKVSWGPAQLQARKPVLFKSARVLVYQFPSVDAAREFEARKIAEKLRKGYERRTRWR